MLLLIRKKTISFDKDGELKSFDVWYSEQLPDKVSIRFSSKLSEKFADILNSSNSLVIDFNIQYSNLYHGPKYSTFYINSVFQIDTYNLFDYCDEDFPNVDLDLIGVNPNEGKKEAKPKKSYVEDGEDCPPWLI